MEGGVPSRVLLRIRKDIDRESIPMLALFFGGGFIISLAIPEIIILHPRLPEILDSGLRTCIIPRPDVFSSYG